MEIGEERAKESVRAKAGRERDSTGASASKDSRLRGDGACERRWDTRWSDVVFGEGGCEWRGDGEKRMKYERTGKRVDAGRGWVREEMGVYMKADRQRDNGRQCVRGLAFAWRGWVREEMGR